MSVSADNGGDSLGQHDHPSDTITVKLTGNHAQDMATFYHELVHAILFEVDESLYTNETFINAFSGLLHQALSTAEYDAPITNIPGVTITPMAR